MRPLFCLMAFAGVAGFVLGLGEAVVFACFVLLPVWGWRSGKSLLATVTVVVGLVGMLLHLRGFKVYGSPSFVRIPQLSGAARVAKLEPPSTIRFADGSTATIAGVYFPKAVDLQCQNENNFLLWYCLGERTPNADFMVRMQPDSRRAECLRHINYWCGNTFYPSTFPRRLPTHETIDVASLLVSSMLALPVVGNSEESDMRRDILNAFDHSFFQPSAGVVPQGDAEAMSLGRQLSQPGSRYFVAGAYLLIAAQDTAEYDRLDREVHRRMERNRDHYDAIAQARSQDLDSVLAWVNLDEARRQIAAAGVPGRFPSWIGQAEVLASHGDLSALDSAVAALDAPVPDAAAKGNLWRQVPLLFRWRGPGDRFKEWYGSVRPRLKAGRDEMGRIAFWLEGGAPFDKQYFATMSAGSGRQ